MITTVANSLFDRLIEEFPADRSYTCSDLSRAPMPKPVSDYLAHLMKERLDRALPTRLGGESWIDPTDDQVRSARAAFREVLERRQRIPSSDWPDTLRRACRETLRFLVRPASALADAVFDGTSSPVGPEVIYSRLGFFPSYPYFRGVIEAYFDQKQIARIDRRRFEGLVNRIDRQMTADYTPSQWRKLLQPLIRVLDAAGMSGEVPVDLLKAFLADKGAVEHLERLKHGYGLNGVVPVDEIVEIFREEKAADESQKPTETTEASSRSGSAKTSSLGRGRVPLWKQFEQGQTWEPEEFVADVPAAAPQSSEPLWKQFRAAPKSDQDRTAVSEVSELSDLERSVLGDRGSRNRDLFIKHLFAGKRDAYEATLRTLQQARSWSEASQIIAREVFLKHQVNIYSDPAVSFTDAAEAQFRS